MQGGDSKTCLTRERGEEGLATLYLDGRGITVGRATSLWSRWFVALLGLFLKAIHMLAAPRRHKVGRLCKIVQWRDSLVMGNAVEVEANRDTSTRSSVHLPFTTRSGNAT